MAECKDDNEYSIEIEALKLETESCKQSLIDKIKSLSSESTLIERMIGGFHSDFYSLKELDFNQFSN